MDSFEINKILGAILFTCLVMLSLNIAAGAMFSPAKPAKPGYEVAVTEEPAQGAKPEAAAPAEPIEKLLASASVEKGEQAAKKCVACHTFTKGGPNRVGPNLWGIVNRPKASEAGFAYSDAIKTKGGKALTEAEFRAVAALVHDRMTQDVLNIIPDQKVIFKVSNPTGKLCITGRE